MENFLNVNTTFLNQLKQNGYILLFDGSIVKVINVNGDSIVEGNMMNEKYDGVPVKDMVIDILSIYKNKDLLDENRLSSIERLLVNITD